MPTKTYQIVVSVIFGIVGFAVNFLDIQLFTSPEFKVTLCETLIETRGFQQKR